MVGQCPLKAVLAYFRPQKSNMSSPQIQRRGIIVDNGQISRFAAVSLFF